MADFADDFNRADNADLGANWTPSGGEAFEINSNTAHTAFTGNFSAERWVGGAVGNEQYSETVVDGMEGSANRGTGPAARMTAGADTMYRAYLNSDAAGEVQLEKRVAGTPTVLASYTAGATPASGDTIRIEVRTVGADAEIKVLHNGVERISHTDSSSPLTSGDVGIAGHPITGFMQVNSWAGGDLSGGGGTMTFYLNNPIVGGGSAGTLAVSAPTASTSTTGWTVGTTVATRYSRQTYNVEVPSGNFTVTAQPSGSPVNSAEDCWRLSAVTSGSFSAGTWYSSLSVIAVTSGGFQDGRARFRIWRSANADGTSATELTQGAMVGTTVTNLSTTVAQSSSASTQIVGFSLTNEFLLLQVAWETL